MKNSPSQQRRSFLQKSLLATAGTFFLPQFFKTANSFDLKPKIKVNGHLWVYASKFLPNWNAYPDLEKVFADMSYAGLDGIELMESILSNQSSILIFFTGQDQNRTLDLSQQVIAYRN